MSEELEALQIKEADLNDDLELIRLDTNDLEDKKLHLQKILYETDDKLNRLKYNQADTMIEIYAIKKITGATVIEDKSESE